MRPYALVRGRTRPSGEALDVIAMVHTLGLPTPAGPDLGPEHLALLEHAHTPMSVADLASRIDLPLGVVRILLGDLRDLGLVRIHRPRPAHLTDVRLLREVADGLRRL